MLKRNYTIAALLIVLVLGNTGCGYKVRSSVGSLPEGIQSLEIPTFENLTTHYRLEQLITGAVLKAFNARTRIPVHSGLSGADAVLFGEIQSVQSTPVTFDPRSFGSAYMVTLQISARLIRQEDSNIIWRNESLIFRERYTLNSDVKDFFSEENPALGRIADDLAESLVNSIIESNSLDPPKP
jgi:outer membrane lipopolysaccharide assembly protein LptE/RlpB